MKKKIIFFYPNVLDDGLRTTFQTYLEYFKHEFDLTIICSNKFKKIKLNKSLKKENFKNNVFYLIKILNKYKSNAVIFSLDKHFFLLILKMLGFRFKLILRIPNPINQKSNLSLSKDAGDTLSWFEMILLKHANKVIIYSKTNYLFLKKNYKLQNVELVRNYFQKKKIKKRPIKIKNIFFIGRLIKSKDPLFFLKGCFKLKKRYRFNINIIGQGPCMSELKKFSKKNNMHVNFYGFVKNPFNALKKKIDLICITSMYDGTPNVLGEAISYKIPCLAPKNVGNSNELLNYGKAGGLYKLKQISDFKNKLENILKNPRQANFKATKAYDHLELYSKENTLNKLKGIIKNLFI